MEKHTNSIFSKLGLTEEKDVNRRVKAVLVYLSDPGGGRPPPRRWCGTTTAERGPMRKWIR